jgi:tetratricopeptide (TPR) repeat protein
MRSASLYILTVLLVVCAGCFRNSKYYIDRGNTSVASGKFEEASINYRRALQKDANSAEAHFRLGLSETKLQHFQDAWQELTRANNLAPDRDDIRAQLGELCLSGLIVDPSRPQLLYQCLKDVAGQFLSKNPNSFAGLRFKGYVALFDRRMDDAIDSFGRAHQAKPNEPDVAISLIEAFFQNKQDQQAERLARDFIKSNPSHGPVYDALYAHYSARGRLAEAEEIWKLKIANNPSQPTFVTDLARLYWRLGRQDDALSLIGKLLATLGQRAPTYLGAGDFYGSIEHWPEALHQFEEGIRVAPERKVLFQKRIADVLLTEGKRAEAAAVVDDILKQQPHDKEAIAIRAGLKLSGKDPQDAKSAIADYKMLAQSTPDDVALHYKYGQALVLKTDFAGAKSEFEQAIRMRPDYTAPRKALAELALKENKPYEAVRRCDEVISLDPQDVSARLVKAVALRAAGRDGEARNELNAALRLSPGNPSAMLQLALVDINEKEFKAAETALTQLNKFDPTGAAGGFAVMYAGQGQIDRAVDVLKKVTLRAEDSSLIHNMLATLALRTNRYDVAISEYKTLLTDDPGSVLLLLKLSEAYRAKGDWGNSVSVLERAQKAAPEELLPTAMLASTLEGAGRLDLALAQYRRALKLQPENANVLNNVAYLIVETQGDVNEALQLSQRAIQKAPNDPQFADTLGWIYLKKDMPDPALQIFNKLLDKDPHEPTFRYHLGATLIQQGARIKGRAALEAALADGPSKPDADKIRALLAKLNDF